MLPFRYTPARTKVYFSLDLIYIISDLSVNYITKGHLGLTIRPKFIKLSCFFFSTQEKTEPHVDIRFRFLVVFILYSLLHIAHFLKGCFALRFVKFTFTFRHNNCRDSISNEVCDGSSFAHESIYSKQKCKPL